LSGEELGLLRWEGSIQRYEELAEACKKKHGHCKWWLCHTERKGPSKWCGVAFDRPSWRAYITIDGAYLHLGTCKCEGDAAIVADFARVARGLAPMNFTAPWDSVKAWVEAGGNGDVPAVERVVLRGDVCVNGKESVEAAEARDAAAAVEDKIAAKARDPRTRPWFYTDLSDMRDVTGAEWMAVLAGESDDVETVGDLAMVDVFDTDIMLALTGRSHGSARTRLWRFKRDAADFLGVKIPKEVPEMPAKTSTKERPPEHRRVPDGVTNCSVPSLIG
jgi:hypothetical protein